MSVHIDDFSKSNFENELTRAVGYGIINYGIYFGTAIVFTCKTRCV